MRANSRSSGLFAIASHPIFKPALMGWAALVIAVAIFVLPSDLIAQFAAMTGLSVLGDAARYVLALIGAVIGGGIGFGLAALIKSGQSAATTCVETEHETAPSDAFAQTEIDQEAVRPIDPASELGSESLDAPIENAQFEEIDDQEVADVEADPVGEQELTDEPEPPQGRRRNLAQLARDEAEASGLADENVASRVDDAAMVTEPGEEALGSFETGDESNVSAPKVELPDPAEAQSALDALISSSATPLKDGIEDTVIETGEESELPDAPVSLDLDEFAALPGRNAVWVEEIAENSGKDQEAAPSLEPIEETRAEDAIEAPLALPKREIPSALAQLRATPIEELNMVQMIERLAAALEDRKEALASNPSRLSDPSGRQALADGLKALGAMADKARASDVESISDPGSATDTSQSEVEDENRPLYDSPEPLADLRGAA
ncbi:MAG: hypothetical protein AAGL10_06880 [Pseudomonadota bacterium]